MDMDALTLDQFRVLMTVVQEGSFSAAARKLNRAQTAITYAIQKLEEQIGVDLFDRTAYRPILTESGRALLPRVRTILQEVDSFSVQARGIAGGLETELSLVVDSMFPMSLLVGALAGFQEKFPFVQNRVHVETLGAAAQAIVDGAADLGLITAFASELADLMRTTVARVELVPVAAPEHPLCQMDGPLPTDVLRAHVQLVLSDRSSLTEGRDLGVVAVRTWRLADLGAKHAMLLAGLGWGSMPLHMVSADLKARRLVRLRPTTWDGSDRAPKLAMVLARRHDRVLGPAGTWLVHQLTHRSAALF
jgi:DNA-binding transcriptional LysR family regulator